MSSFRTTSPLLTMSPQSAHLHQSAMDIPFFQNASGSFPSAWVQGARQHVAPSPRGRKRSRDEAAVNLDPPEKVVPAVEPVKEDEDEWEYGPGMVLIKKASGYVHDASSQSGTWLEENAAKQDQLHKEEALLAQQREAQDRPSLRSHKSSRLDLSAANRSAQEAYANSQSSPGRNMSDSVSASTAGAGGASLTPDGIISAGPGCSQPVVDDFTVHLGIGWSRLSDDQHLQAAARGWARYIENHYVITEPRILLKSKGLESYLVEAREGYFLFAEDLHQGRLVSSDATRALNNLKSSPPIFDGDSIMTAAVTPRPAEVEMDMN